MKRTDATSFSHRTASILRRRERRHSIGATPGERPGDARHLVGERNGHHLERSPCQELHQPRIFLRVLPGPPQHGMRPDHKNAPQVAIAPFGDWPKLPFTSGRIFSWDEPNPGGKITPRPECLRVRDSGGNGARANEADPWNTLQSLA